MSDKLSEAQVRALKTLSDMREYVVWEKRGMKPPRSTYQLLCWKHLVAYSCSNTIETWRLTKAGRAALDEAEGKKP